MEARSVETGSSRTRWLPALLALSAGIAGAHALGWLPVSPPALWIATAPAFFLGAAWPLLLRRTRTTPSAHKLFVLSLALSPVLVTVGWMGMRRLLPAEAARGVVFLGLAALQLLARGRSPHAQPAGRAALASLALGLLTAALVGSLLLRGGSAATWLADGAPWHVGMAGAVAESASPENPWLAGTRPPCHVGLAPLLAVAARSLGLSAVRTLGVIAAVSLLVTAYALYHLAAALWREERRAFLSVALALLAAPSGLGLAELGGWYAESTRGARTEHGLAGFLDPGVLPLDLALASVAWMCAAHALRNAARPWVGAMGLAVGAAGLLDPLPALVLAAGLALASLVGSPSARVRLRACGTLCLAVLPALSILFTRGACVQPLPESPATLELGRYALRLAVPFLGALGLLLDREPSGGGRRAATGAAGSERRALLALLLSASAAAAFAPCLGEALARRQDDLARLASLPACVLAAGGWVALFDAGKGPRAAALVSGVLTLCGAGVLLRAGLSGTWRAAAGGWRFGSEQREGMSEAYDWLRSGTDPRLERALLVLSPEEPQDHLERNLAPHEAPVLTGMPLFCDWNDAFAADRERSRLRRGRLSRLYGFDLGGKPEADWDPRTFVELERALVVVVEPSDVERSRGRISRRLPYLGCEPLRAFGPVELWLRPARSTTR